MTRALARAAALAALVATAPALAYVYELTESGQPIHWPQLKATPPTPLAFTYNAKGSAMLGGPLSGNAALKAALDEAIAKWGQVPSSTVQFAPSTVSVNERLVAEDGQNLVVFTSVNPQDFTGEDGPFIVGLTTTSFIPATGVLVDADMQFNDGIPGKTPQFYLSLTDRTGTQRSDGKMIINLRDVVTHEMGHALGLDHSGVKGSTMYFAATDSASTLKPDDIAGISSLYPSPTFRSITGVITGRVTRAGTSVFGAHVVAINIATGQPAIAALSAPDGKYRLDGLAPGRYVVMAEGYRPNVAGVFYEGAEPGVELSFHAPSASSPPTVLVVRAALELSGIDVFIEQRRIDATGGTSLADAIPLPAGSAHTRRLPPASASQPHDLFSFEASRGTTLTINITAHRIWVPINPRLEVLDAGLNVLAASSDLSPAAPEDLDDRLSFSPGAAGPQTYYLRVKAATAAGDTFPDPRSVKEGESLYLLTTQSTRTNRPPRIVGSEAFSSVTTTEAGVERGAPFVADLANAGADDEDSASALTWVASSVPPHLLTVDPAGLAARPPVLRIVPKPYRSGSGTFNLVLYDSDDASATVPISVTINPVNDPPKLKLDTSPALLRGGPRLVQLDAGASRAGPDGDTAEDGQGLTYAWTQVAGPRPVRLDGTSAAVLKGLARDAGVYRFQLTGTETGTDARLASTLVQDVTVENLPPRARATVPPLAIPGQLVRVRADLSSDPNEDLTTGAFALTQVAPLDVTVPTTRTGAAAFAFVAPAQPGRYSFELKVTDSGYLELGGARSNPLSDRTTFTVEVRSPDELPPTADAGADRVATVADVVTLDGRDSIGAAGEVLTYGWRADTANPAPAEPSPADAATPTVTMPQVPGVYAFHLTVRGARTGLTSATATCRVRVLAASAANRFPPVARARVLGGLSNAPVGPGDRVLLDATGSADPESGLLSFAWTQVEGPRVALSSESGSTPSFVPPAPGLYRFKLVVSDGTHASRPVFVELPVLPPGAAPGRLAVRAVHPASNTARTPPEELRFLVDGAFTASSRIELAASVESGPPLRAVAWQQLGGPTLPFDVSEDGRQLTIIPRQARVHTFRASAVLTDGQVVEKTVHVLVDRPTSRIPRATLAERPALDVVTGADVELDGSGSRDLTDAGEEKQSTSLVYYWDQEDGPPVPLTAATSAHPVFKPPMPGRYAFRLRVDNQRFGTLSAPSSVALVAEVREPAPVAVNNLTESPAARSPSGGGGRAGGCVLVAAPDGEVDLTPLLWLFLLAWLQLRGGRRPNASTRPPAATTPTSRVRTSAFTGSPTSSTRRWVLSFMSRR